MNENQQLASLARRLETLNQDIQARPRQIRQFEKDLHLVYDDLCAAYLNAGPEQRIDVLLALEFRDRLLDPLVAYYKYIAAQAAKAAQKKRQDQTTAQLTRQAVTASLLIGRSISEEEIAEANQQVLQAAAVAKIDLEALRQRLEIPYRYFVQRALQYHRGRDRIRALKALGIAIQVNPALEKDDRVQALAATLTNETELSAMITTSDHYLLKKFVENLEEEDRIQRSRMQPKSRTTLDVIRSWFAS
ncbi:MAG: hypothetical protein K8J31_16170 [Anaerolineae bacterium]|nr:hypothetical protein [Anaerolineae bacterium]